MPIDGDDINSVINKGVRSFDLDFVDFYFARIDREFCPSVSRFIIELYAGCNRDPIAVVLFVMDVSRNQRVIVRFDCLC